MCVAAQKCTKKKRIFADDYHFEKGTCTLSGDDNNVVVLDPITDKSCKFACKAGYSDKHGDTKIEFTCKSNGNTVAQGLDNWEDLEKCEGV